jgi:hypothetical protein
MMTFFRIVAAPVMLTTTSPPSKSETRCSTTPSRDMKSMSGFGRRPSMSCEPRACFAPAMSGMSYFLNLRFWLSGIGTAMAVPGGAGSTFEMSCCVAKSNTRAISMERL